MKRAKTSLAEDLPTRLSDLANGRDEMNLCELPFATLSERNQGRTKLTFDVEDVDRESGQVVRRTLTVTGDPEYGLPTEKDEEIYLALLKYSSDLNGFSDPEVRFSRAALFELLGWPKTDWAYERLTLGMQRLVGVRLNYKNLWRDNRDKQWHDQGAFGILDSFEFRDSRRAGRVDRERSSVFRWGSVLFQSFDSGYLKRIDYGLARTLSPTARRLYRYLDKHFHPPRKTRIVIDLERLAYQHIGVSRGIALDKARRRYIGPALEELQQVGYLAAATDDPCVKVRRGTWNVVVQMAPPQPVRHANGPQNKITAALERRGVSAATAMTLSATHDLPAIRQAVQAFDEQQRGGTTIRAADRWFQAALEKGYRPSATTARSARRPELQVVRAPRE